MVPDIGAVAAMPVGWTMLRWGAVPAPVNKNWLMRTGKVIPCRHWTCSDAEVQALAIDSGADRRTLSMCRQSMQTKWTAPSRDKRRCAKCQRGRCGIPPRSSHPRP
jgi:hypothetical protein